MPFFRQAGLGRGRQSCTVYCSGALNIHSRMWHCRRLTVTASQPGIWLNPLTTDDGNGLRGFSW
nr:conjugative transfer relaxase/helicase TraI domain-containing protein [Escherichia coli]